MKIVIALACLVAFSAAVEETGQIDADLDVAEQRYGGGHGGGQRGGHQGGRGGGGGRYGRSLEEAQPFIVAEFQPEYADYVSDDLQLAENRNYGGYGGNGNHGSGGRRGRRSVEDENAGAIEDLEVAENGGGSYNRGHSSDSAGYRQSGSYGNNRGSSGGGYGGNGHRGGRSVEEIGAIEDLEVAEHHNKGYGSQHGGSSGYDSYGRSSSGYGRPSGGHGSHSGHGGSQHSGHGRGY
ncbi:cold and drought-regulated protein CORA-like isoform X9 [Daphnia pulicaria]|uniref:cold and drought-regulated protein CORA-like isoform X9 n=1 Tax=Daphnia pulicaria TaxID=35523 RepID=UPI001EEA5CEA|nr:cold and drought-regulated protein CORA-like isoform X9 [Daphnia pulicaria]